MPYTNNAQTLADIVGGPSAAYQSGQEQGNQDYADMMKNQVSAGTQQADIARPGLQNALMQAQTGAEQGVAQQQQAKGQLDQATLPGQIGATNAKLTTEQMQAKAQGLSTIGQIAGQVAGMMDNVPGPARPAAMAQILQKYNIDPSSLGALASGDPDQLRQFSRSAIKNSAGYVQTMDVERQKAASAQDVAGINQTGEISKAQIMAQASTQRAQIAAEAKQKLMNMGQLQASLEKKVADGSASPQEIQQVNQLREANQVARQNPYMANLLFGGQGNGEIPGGTMPQVPQVPMPQGSTSPMTPNRSSVSMPPEQMQSAAKQLWPNDDPTKYDYRVDPNSGNLQRKAK